MSKTLPELEQPVVLIGAELSKVSQHRVLEAFIPSVARAPAPRGHVVPRPEETNLVNHRLWPALARKVQSVQV